MAFSPDHESCFDGRGWNVADRGRIPQHIIDEYDKAHQ
jgi:hypothetical protein